MPGLVLTTEQGSVFVLGPIWPNVYTGTLCVAEPKTEPQRGSEYGETCGKANSTKLFFGFWLSGAA